MASAAGALLATVALAAEKPATHATTTSAMAASDDKAAEACKAMSHDAMMKDARCAALMKSRPTLFTAAGGREGQRAKIAEAKEVKKEAKALSPVEGGGAPN
jgi:hypothetical protein